MSNYKRIGHITPNQYMEEMYADGGVGVSSSSNSSQRAGDSTIDENDVVVDDVLPKSKLKKAPLFTKKGKITLALITLGFIAYELYTRNKAKKEVASTNSTEPSPSPEPKAESVQIEPKAEMGGEASNVSDSGSDEFDNRTPLDV